MKRSAFQGVLTVVRFNWHFYAGAAIGIAALWIVARFLPPGPSLACLTVAMLAGLSVCVSLVATWLAYDASGLYDLHWLDEWMRDARGNAANIHAGFDETSALLRARYAQLRWQVFDFYDPAKHTEISIRRARKAHPPSPETIPIDTHQLPVADGALERVLLILAAHEIRDPAERVAFFLELRRTLVAGGLVIVAEHVRDFPNTLVYNLGSLHFHSRSTWQAAFDAARFEAVATLEPAPLITAFVLKKT